MEHPVGTSLWSALGIAARYNKFKDVVPTVQRIRTARWRTEEDGLAPALPAGPPGAPQL